MPGPATAVVGQRLLEAIFGDEAVRRMAKGSRESLTGRLDALVAERSAPFLDRLDALGDDDARRRLEADAEALAALARDIREETR